MTLRMTLKRKNKRMTYMVNIIDFIFIVSIIDVQLTYY